MCRISGHREFALDNREAVSTMNPGRLFTTKPRQICQTAHLTMEQELNTRQSLPRVTVVTVLFNIVRGNRVEHFRQCMDSVLKQTHPDIEHLLVDGASTDGTLDLLREYEGKRGVRIISEPDTGIYDAMNKGVAAATGKYVAFLNTDDYWHDPRGLEYSVESLERTQADFSFAPCHYVNDDGSEVGNMMPELGCVCSSMPFCHQTMLTRVDAIRKVGGFADKELRITADYDLILNLLVHGAKPVYVPLNFTTFCMGGANAVNQERTEADFSKARVRQLQSLVSPPIVEMLGAGYMPDCLYRVLNSHFHPSAMLCLMDAHGKEDENGLRRLKKHMRLSPPSEDLDYPQKNRKARRYYGPLGILLMRSLNLSSGMRLYLLFGFLPIMGKIFEPMRYSNCWRLFGLIPTLRTERRNSGTVKSFLFGIPLWRFRFERR